MRSFVIPVLILCIGGFSFVIQAEFSNDGIKINKVKGKKYYHLQFDLTKKNFKVNKKYGFNEGGIFEVYIDKKIFPVNAPKCNKNIILRMPWTDTTIKNAGQYVREKEALYNKLINIGDNSQKVIIELNPYVKENNGNVELTRCNVFFRHANGRYIDSLD